MALTQSYKSREKVLGNIAELVRRIRNINGTTDRYTQDATRYGTAYSEIATVANARLTETGDLFTALQAEFDYLSWEHQQYIKTNLLTPDFVFNTNRYDFWDGPLPSNRLHFLEFIGQQNPWTLLEKSDNWTLEQGQNQTIFSVLSSPAAGVSGGAVLTNNWASDRTGWTGFDTDWVYTDADPKHWAKHTTGNITVLSQSAASQPGGVSLIDGQVGIVPIEVDFDAAPAGTFSVRYGPVYVGTYDSAQGAGTFYAFVRGSASQIDFEVIPSSTFNGLIRFAGNRDSENIDLGKRIPAVAINFIKDVDELGTVTNAAIRLLEREVVIP